MNQAATANETRRRLGPDFTLVDALDPEYLDTDEVEDVDLMSVEQRQSLNAALAAWWEV